MSTPTSALPKVMQAKMSTLQDASAEPSNTPTPTEPAQSEPESAQPTAEPSTNGTSLPPAPEERVTISREEYNELQAATASTARLGVAQDRIEELTARLTELESAAKGKPQEPAPAAPAIFDVGDVAFTEEEEKDFGDSKDFITKVVKLQLKDFSNALESRIKALEDGVNSAHDVATKTGQNSFKRDVMSAVPDLQKLITHKHWPDFHDTIESISGKPYGHLLAAAFNDGSVERAKNIYNIFRDKFVGKDNSESLAAAYSGGVPSGTATQEPVAAAPTEKMKLSDRKKLSDDYKKGRASWKDLEEFDKKFAEAEKNGNVDYNA